MKMTISQTYFVNRTFVTKLSYNKVIDLLCDISEKDKFETNSKYINDVAKNFFNKNEFSFSKNAKSYIEYPKNVLKKSDYAIFLVNRKKLKEEFETFACDPASRLFGNDGILLELKNLRKEIEHNINLEGKDPESAFWKGMFNDIDGVISQSINYQKDDYNSCIEYYKLVRERNSNWKNDVSLHPKCANSRILSQFATFDKCLHDLENYLTVKNIFASSIIKCIVVSSKTGFISVSFVVEYVGEGGHLYINKLDTIEDVIREGIEKSDIINSRINSIPNLFSYIDFNHLLGLNNISIIDNLAKDYNTHKEKNVAFETEKEVRNKSIEFNNNFTAYKCTHLRFAVDAIETSDKLPMFLYDYVSLLTAHNYSYDSLYLWNIVTKNDSELEKSDNIIDYIGKPTEHMYIDDSSVLISVINPLVTNTILKEKAKVDLPSSSHQLRIYSFWRFMYACNALSFGGMAVLSSYLLDAISINYFSKYYKKIKMVYLYHKYSYLSSYICSQFDIKHFYAKTSNMATANSIFIKLDIDGLIAARKQRTDEIWKHANLSNTQLYNRYGLILSTVSLLISIISYGLVSAIFIDKQSVHNAIDFFEVVFSTPKFYFIMLIGSVPLVVWLIAILAMTLFRKKNFSLIKESKVFKEFPSSNVISTRHNDKKVEKHKKPLTFKKIIARIKAIRK